MKAWDYASEIEAAALRVLLRGLRKEMALAGCVAVATFVGSVWLEPSATMLVTVVGNGGANAWLLAIWWDARSLKRRLRQLEGKA